MTEPVTTLEGWYILHDFRRFDWLGYQSASEQEKNAAKEELFSLLKKWSAVEQGSQGSVGCYEVTGHKADFLFLNLRPTIQELTGLERELNQTHFAKWCKPVFSYVSVAELSTYAVDHAKKMQDDPRVNARLKPILPKTNHVCFYPMNKKRDAVDNWYSLPPEERQRMMHSHGLIGRSYAGRVTQMIGGSMGFDDWEWGVTLFADDPLVFKKIVQEMRFDEVSARFGEFGPFYVGNRLTTEALFEQI